MSTRTDRGRWRALAALAAVCLLATPVRRGEAHVVPPEKLHPVAESYRRLAFLLDLNPVLWQEVERDARSIARGLAVVDALRAERYRTAVAAVLEPLLTPLEEAAPPTPGARIGSARRLFELTTEAVARTLKLHLDAARAALGDYTAASRSLEEARQIWAAFEPAVRATDVEAFHRLGECWLELVGALGSPGILGLGTMEPDPEAFREDSQELIEYIELNFGDRFEAPKAGRISARPTRSPTFEPLAPVPYRLPPGSTINKQLPRPRQILNMTSRGVDEGETALIALGDMAFDSPFIFGEPARSLALSCNSCHNKSITNPQLFIPGLSARPGGIDVSNSFFAPYANNGHFDPLDIPDLRGIRFTSPYGRNGRFASLREFIRNVIVNEFAGSEPGPTLLDGLVAYMLEFDFLANPHLKPDGTLRETAPEAARRGEVLFHRPFPQMGGRSCASCHLPADHFLDRKRHDIGTVQGSEAGSRDRALDTPTLLSARFTAPYFHDGSQPTLKAVNEWFNERFGLGLSEAELGDLTAYVETVGDGTDPYEESVYTLEAEMEEFRFFLSTYEFLKRIGKPDLLDTTFRTIASEIQAHKWDVQDQRYLPILGRLAALMDEATEAIRAGDGATVDTRVAEYRRLYEDNLENLR
ncbi:MAG: cytochrome c peroxidase [Thermoanaerobaculia bacterium]